MDYRSISEGKYRYERVADTTLRLKALKGCKGTVVVYGKDGLEYARLEDDSLTIRAKYRFNGCDMAPDCLKAIAGCEVHDCLRQMILDCPTSLTWEQSNKAMREVHRRDRFRLAWLYYLVVHGPFGKLYAFFKSS